MSDRTKSTVAPTTSRSLSASSYVFVTTSDRARHTLHLHVPTLVDYYYYDKG
jgi:hypothetical protein